MTKLGINDGKGLHLTFDNGVCLSVQIGGGNYCDNYHEPLFAVREDRRYQLPVSHTAEISVFHADGTMVDIGEDQVKGWVQIDDVLKFVEYLRSLPPKITEDHLKMFIGAFVWPEKPNRT